VILASLISYPRAVLLGLLQGVSELFPVSSLGHSVILPRLLGWNIHQNDKYFVTFLVATHLATALVLLGFFWRDWVRIVTGLGRSLRDRGIAPEDADAKLGWLLVVGTIPAGILGLLQGVSELFPVSSLGHSVILPKLLGWNIHQNDKYFITFLVATHLATALVLLGFFWRDWVRIVKGLARSLREREIREDDADAKLGWLLVIGTIPAGILGLLLEHKLRSVFASAQSAAFFLMLNGVLLYGAELLRRRAPEHEAGDPDARIAQRMGWRGAFAVGAAQAIALIPGFSRSGATMAGGLLVGLSNKDAARYSFLLATPIIGAAAALKLPELFGPQGNGVRGPALVGAICSGFTAYLAVRFLMRYFETNRLTPFAVYCLIAGAATSIYFLAV
jgi:undecaprenyl-diphosphatase